MGIFGPLQIFLDSQHNYLRKEKGNGENMNASVSTEYGPEMAGNHQAGPGQGRQSKLGINVGEAQGGKK